MTPEEITQLLSKNNINVFIGKDKRCYPVTLAFVKENLVEAEQLLYTHGIIPVDEKFTGIDPTGEEKSFGYPTSAIELGLLSFLGASSNAHYRSYSRRGH